MDEEQVAAGLERTGEKAGEVPDVFPVEIVDDLGEHDQVEAARWRLIGDLQARQRDLRQRPASLAGLGQGFVGHVDGQEPAAARGKHGGQHADRAADLEAASVELLRQGGERGRVLVTLVVAAREPPWVRVACVEGLEVAGRQRAGHRQSSPIGRSLPST